MSIFETNYQKVIHFNKVFGVQVSEKPRHNVFDQDPKLVELRMNLIREEVRELEDAVKDKDMTETLDALSDILYVVYGMGASLGLDLDKGMGLVHESNMSKSCKTEKDAQDTVIWYQEKYSSGEQPYDTPAYRKSNDGEYWIVYNSSTGKILKSIKYSPVDFTEMLSLVGEK